MKQQIKDKEIRAKNQHMIKSIHHVQITVPKSSEEAARNFYCGILQLNEIEKPHILKLRGGLWVKVGDREVHIGTEDGIDRKATKAHLAYEVSDISFWRSRLTSEGIEIQDPVSIPGLERFEFRDPLGNRLEMIMRVLPKPL